MGPPSKNRLAGPAEVAAVVASPLQAFGGATPQVGALGPAGFAADCNCWWLVAYGCWLLFGGCWMLAASCSFTWLQEQNLQEPLCSACTKRELQHVLL